MLSVGDGEVWRGYVECTSAMDDYARRLLSNMGSPPTLLELARKSDNLRRSGIGEAKSNMHKASTRVLRPAVPIAAYENAVVNSRLLDGTLLLTCPCGSSLK